MRYTLWWSMSPNQPGSPTDVVARAIVATRAEREAYEAELEHVPALADAQAVGAEGGAPASA